MRHGWSIALDKQMDTHRWCRTEGGVIFNSSFFASTLENFSDDYSSDDVGPLLSDALGIARHFQETLWRADTIFVTSDMLHILLQAAHDLPDEATIDFHTLITPCGFCLFEEAIIGVDRHDRTVVVNGIAWNKARVRNIISNPESGIHDYGEGPHEIVVVYFLSDPYDMRDTYNEDYVKDLQNQNIPVPPLAPMHLFPLIDGQKIPQPNDDPGTELVSSTLKLFVAMQLLAQQKLGEPMVLPPDRAQRKRVGRYWGSSEVKLVTLITLRRKNVKHDDESQKIERTHRWIVRGHWRRQWYPSLGRHDWKYIYEHIRGPENKPLVITERRVFNFRR